MTTSISDRAEQARVDAIVQNTDRAIAERRAQTAAQQASIRAEMERVRQGAAAAGASPGVTGSPTTNAQQASAKLKDRLKATTGGAANGVKDRLDRLSTVQLADTLISTGPKDELLTVDVLGVSDANILNSLSNKLSGFDTGPLESFRSSSLGGGGSLTSLLTSNLGGGFSIDPSQMADRILSSITGGQGAIRGLSSSLQNSVLGGSGLRALGNMAASNILSSMGVNIGGQLSSFNNNNFSDARGIFDLVNRVSNQPGLARYVDTGAQSSLLSGVFRECMRVGVPMAITALLDNDRLDSNAVDYALRSNMVDAINYSDITTAAQIIQRVGANQILADTPNAIQQLLANYRFPVGTTYAQYGARWTELNSVLTSIDPNWGKYVRNGEAVDDLKVYTRLSADAMTLLMSVPGRKEAAMIAKNYNPVNLRNAAKAMYPLAAI